MAQDKYDLLAEYHFTPKTPQRTHTAYWKLIFEHFRWERDKEINRLICITKQHLDKAKADKLVDSNMTHAEYLSDMNNKPYGDGAQVFMLIMILGWDTHCGASSYKRPPQFVLDDAEKLHYEALALVQQGASCQP